MMIILCLVSIALIIFCLTNYTWEDEVWIPICGLGIKLVVVGFLISELIRCGNIEKRIEIYEQHNQMIEEKVEVVVKQYMDHENKTFTDLKSESYITLVSLYPELKSDELIAKEISLYEENNKKILELKEEKLDARIYRFWLYFGR